MIQISWHAFRSKQADNRHSASKSVIRWMAVGLISSSACVIIISVLSGVSLSDFATVGFLPFGLAAAASGAGLLVSVLRFRVVRGDWRKTPDLT
jgi:hypothetical protein